MLARSLALALIMVMPASAGILPPEPVAGPIRVIDGDTVRLSSGEIIRLYNIDAPETHEPRCPAEASAGARATAIVRGLLANGPVTISRCEPATGRCADRYGRTLATLSTPAGDVGDILVSKGVVLPWQPGRAAHEARRRHWCGR